MKFLIFWNKCNKCGYEWETLSDPGLYTYRLLLSERSFLPAIVNCDDDHAFGEIHRIVEKLLKPKGNTAIQIANRFDEVFGKVCDLAPDGSRYNMTGKRNCPNCKSNEIAFGPYESDVIREEDPPEIKHRWWDQLSAEEKEIEISKHLNWSEHNS